MSLIEIKSEPELLKRLIGCLERIADALEIAYPHPQARQMKPYGPEALTTFDPEKEYEIEIEEERLKNLGQTL